ncbi:hypothetical protein JKA73_17365 [Myxococcus xanthus]|uniref:hypothetical protein n=1 Tax=Myxococcus xanthus TaxID=34 RepID=UPI001916FDD4|nr:hypothetical protein [Myxococcus xanthus]QQR47705.1 hypothetical protein JKA73_17365 [Myxococcus xanthus]
MTCRRMLVYASTRTATGWRVSINAEGLPPVSEEAPTSEEAKAAAYAHVQRLADESAARGQPLNLDDYAVQLQFDPEEVFQ